MGLAIGGVFRTAVAAEAVALLVVATYLLDILWEALRPEWTRELTLTAHMGHLMVGDWMWSAWPPVCAGVRRDGVGCWGSRAATTS